MSNQDNVYRLMVEIDKFVFELSRKYSDRVKDCLIPWSSGEYAEAVYKWRKKGKPANHFFSPDNDDPMFLEFKRELTEKYELEVISRKEALERETYREIVTGHLKTSKLMN